MDERRVAALIDAACLLFAYGGFLALYRLARRPVHVQQNERAVYTIGSPSSICQIFAALAPCLGHHARHVLRGLQVVDFSGRAPHPAKITLARGWFNVLSAGTFFLGFLWAMWDEAS